MQHFRKLSSGFTKLKLKSSERKIWTTKNLNRFVLYKLIDSTKRQEFKSKKISDLKAKYFSHADGRSSFKQSKPAYVVDGPEECQKRRCACFFDLTYEQSKNFLFLDNMHNTDKSQESSIQLVFVRRFIYLTYFDRRIFYSKPELNDQEREIDNQEQKWESTREDIDQIYAS